jgi:hypothetical protein
MIPVCPASSTDAGLLRRRLASIACGPSGSLILREVQSFDT